MISLRSSALLALFALSLAAPAQAHHSAAMFDGDKSVTVSGTVREFQWNSPHCFIQVVDATPQSGGEWSIEMGAPIELTRLGWKKSSLHPGDKVTIVIRPLKDGGKGGRYVSGLGPTGAPLGVTR